MSATVIANGLSVSHKGSGGIARNTLPDVCKTPSPAGPVPVPYPVIVAKSSDLQGGTVTVKADGGQMIAICGSVYSRCTGDEAGTAGGVTSSTNLKESKWLSYSFDVKIEGQGVCRLTDKMTMNHGNTMCLAGDREKRQHGKTPMNNQKQNQEFKEAIRQANKRLGKTLSRDQEQQAHRLVSKQGLGLWEMVEEIVAFFS